MSRRFERFVQVAKLDAERHEVWGHATVEEVDKQGEVVKFDGAVRAFEKHAEYFQKITDGESFGNVRAMHLPIAAGKLIAWSADAKLKAIPIGAHVSDDREWKKCLDKTYVGFSIGGDVTKEHREMRDGREINVIDAFDLVEVSLVDNPACPSARIAVVKMADGKPVPVDPVPEPAPAAALKVEGTPAPIPDGSLLPVPPVSPLEKADPTTVQTLIFAKKEFESADAAKKWASEHDFKSPKVDETEDSFRLRQRDPGDFKEGSFKTVDLKGGVKAVIGHLKLADGRFGKVLALAGKNLQKRSEGASIYPAICALRDLQNAIDSEGFEMAMTEDPAYAEQEKGDIRLLYSAVEDVLAFLQVEFASEVQGYLADEASPAGAPMAMLDWAETVRKGLTPIQLSKIAADEDMKENLDAIHRMGHGLVKASSAMGSSCPDGECPEGEEEQEGEEEAGEEKEPVAGEGEAGGEKEGAGAEGEGGPIPPRKKDEQKAALPKGRATLKGNPLSKGLEKVLEQVGAVKASVDSMGERLSKLEGLPAAVGRSPAGPVDKMIPGTGGGSPIPDPLALLRKRVETETDPARKQTLALVLTEETIKLEQAGIRF